jgi:hypothetical protein
LGRNKENKKGKNTIWTQLDKKTSEEERNNHSGSGRIKEVQKLQRLK